LLGFSKLEGVQEVCKGVMSEVVCVKEGQYWWDNCQISQADCTAEIPWNIIHIHQTPHSSWSVQGGCGYETMLAATPTIIGMWCYEYH